MKQRFVFAAILTLALTSKVFAYDFSSVAPSGQTLYYTFDYTTGGGGVEVTYPGVLDYDNQSYDNCWSGYSKPIGNLTIPSSVSYGGNTYSVTSIGYWAFYGCSGLTSITIPSAVTYIGADAFANCSGIITLNYNAKKCYYAGIRVVILNQHFHGAFYNCTNLSIVNFGDSVTSIPQYLFDRCSAIRSIAIPKPITYIGNAAFLDCGGLSTVNYYATNCTFAGESVGVAFNTCSSLSSVNIGDSVKIIPPNLFGNCIGLSSVYIPNAVEQIGNNAFKGCDHITNITLGKGLTMIGDSAFLGCTQVVRVISNSINPPTAYINTFNGLSDDVILNVPCDAANAYENAAYWFRFNIQEDLVYDFSATSSNPARGTVTIVTEPTCDYREAQVQANAYHGYHFDHWSDGNTDNPRYIVVMQDTTIIAYFYSDNGEDEGIEETAEDGVKLYQRNGQIVVEGAEGSRVMLYDVYGRLLATKRDDGGLLRFDAPAAGVYLVRVGDAPASKVVVIR